MPYDNPELVIYCVIDEPNSESQPHSYYAQNLAREILEEVLPYMNIYQDEELTGKNADLGITGYDPYYTGNRTPEEEVTPGDTPIPEEEPEDIPESLPNQEPEQTPEQSPEQTPEQTPEDNQEQSPEGGSPE